MLKLFENLEFRGIVGVINILLYKHLNSSRYDKKDIVQYGLQSFCSYKVSCRLIQQDLLLCKWFDLLEQERDNEFSKDEPNIQWKTYLISDCFHLFRGNNIQYLIYHYGLDKLLKYVRKYNLIDCIKPRSVHVEYDAQGYPIKKIVI
jgi:hypothetical protein